MTKNRITKISKYTFLILLAVGLLLFYFLFPRFIIEKRNPIIESFKTQKVISNTPGQNDNSKFKRKKLTITTYDNLKHYALLTYANIAEPKGTIILLHGSSHTKEHFLELSEFLSINGFNSVAIDIRGFGESEGQFFTHGVKETKDIQKLIDDLITKEGLDNIGIWGQSIGGALVLQTMGVDKRIKYGVSESSYTDLKSNIRSFFRRHTGVNLPFISDFLVNRAGSIGDFDPNDASPLKYSKRVTQPILVIHGGKDKPINISNGRANYDNIKSNDKEFIEVESAGHSDIWKIGGDDLFNTILQFLNNQAKTSN
ncbi:alpha/beta hydrolase [Winogradskyella thalassocola]|uniref:Alpha/beta hydrolase family protein n=1 Tax=Winogradskyella thalassocola TaxID=262004 RepID=A0A1G8G4K8_9FLAO|nr:alpha/beta fold hydrolase [Winogradskyella thalassocola]SDH89220.1 Alpha/beta hydrolase family protein [Winogradskyella thalassocola]